MPPRPLSTFAVLALAFATLPACLDEDKGEESELPDDGGEADTQRTPTNHGYIFFGSPEDAVLSDAERYHAWEFDLSGPAAIDAFTTYTIKGQRKTDTVLYLYKQQDGGGYGSYIARNDDDGDRVYSRIRKNLEAGHYRVLVKGYLTTTRGKFRVQVDCAGDGCAAPPEPNTCVFGSAYNELDEREALVVTNRTKWYATTDLSPLDRERVVLAVQQSAHSDVTTAEEAFDRVDQNEINAVYIYEPAAARTFLALEYGAGDNSYGAYFEGRTAVMVANIHDGDLENCETPAQTCLLGTTYFEMRNNTGYSVVASRAVTDANTLAGVEEDQALLAFKEAYGDAVTSNAQGLTMADDNRLNIVTYLRNGTGARFDAFEFGAGDNSYGAVFYGDSVTMAAAINDGDFYGCSFFIER